MLSKLSLYIIFALNMYFTILFIPLNILHVRTLKYIKIYRLSKWLCEIKKFTKMYLPYIFAVIYDSWNELNPKRKYIMWRYFHISKWRKNITLFYELSNMKRIFFFNPLHFKSKMMEPSHSYINQEKMTWLF